MKLSNIFKRYKSDTKGNVSLMFAVSFVGTLTLVGAVFDLMLLNKSRQQVQYLTDAAALAALQYEGTIEEKAAIFDSHVQALAALSGGEENQNFETAIEIVERDGALVLNAQVSLPHELIFLQHLGGPQTITLATSAEKGIQDIEIALVLDISSSMAGARITEAKAAATLFVEQLLDNESLNERVSISLVPFGGTVRLPVELSTLLDTPLADLEDYSENWIDGEWNQCFEYDITDTRNGINPDRLYRVTPDFTSYSARNPWCPIAGNELVPLSQDKAALLERIDALTLSDGTGSDHGMAWGVETLNPEWRNEFPDALDDTPADFSTETRKFIVFMTDGGITAQHHVRENDRVGDVPYYSKRRVHISFSNSRTSFYGACDRAKNDDTTVFTIGFNLNNNNQKTVLENCATQPSNYIDARTGDLDGVFGDLANQISPLRVTN